MSVIRYITKIYFADEVLEHALEGELGKMGVGCPLVLWDEEGSDDVLMQRLERTLTRSLPSYLLLASPKGTTGEVSRATAAAYRERRCDGLVAFGGAAASHLARAVGIEVSHSGPLQNYFSSEGGSARIQNRLPPFIAVPTSAGSGAEASDSAIVALEKGGYEALISPHLIPDVIIYDPTLTLGMSGRETANAGAEILANCIETFISSAFNPPADALAMDGLRRAYRHLEQAVTDGHDLGARREMMAAALNGSLAQQKGLGALRAMRNALVSLGISGNDKGAACAVLLPLMLQFNAPAAGDRYMQMSRQMGLQQKTDLAEAVSGLRERIGLPSRLSELGIGKDQIARAAYLAASDHATRTNPRKAGPEDYLTIMTAAL